MRTVPGNQEFIILSTLRLARMFNREKMFYHPLMSMYTLRHQTAGPLPQVLPLDIVISW